MCSTQKPRLHNVCKQRLTEIITGQMISCFGSSIEFCPIASHRAFLTNRQAELASDPVHPLPLPLVVGAAAPAAFPPQFPVNFPATRGDLVGLAGPAVDALLAQYNLPTAAGTTVKYRKNRLAEHIGMRAPIV